MLAPEFLPVWGGVGTYIVELVRHLPKNVEIHVITPMREGFDREKVSASDQDLSRYFGTNVRIHFVCKARDTFSYNASFQYACMKYVPKLVKEENIDLIHSHTAHMPDLLLLFRKLGKPIITTVHTTIKSQRTGTKISGEDLSYMEKSERATRLMYPILRLAEEIYFRQKRFYVTPSNWMKRWFETNYHVSGAVRVIPNSVDTNEYESTKCDAMLDGIIPQELTSRRIVLYVGRLLAMKGVKTLLEAVPKVLAEAGENTVLFVFAGSGNSAGLMSGLKEMKVQSNCYLTGPLSKREVIQLMMAAEVTVVPSFLENCPYVVLESMACGRPVIASNVGGIPEIITDQYDGILVKPNSPALLADAIVGLLQNETIRNVIGQRARETVIKKFSWSVNLTKYLETYSEVLDQ
jgi:glycosyltransferase involved in cell wall biosynthesis